MTLAKLFQKSIRSLPLFSSLSRPVRSRGEINGSSVESTGHFPWSLIVKAGEVSRKGPSRWWIQNGWEARRTTVFNRKVRAEKDKGIRKEYDLMKAHLNERAIFTGEWDYTIVPRGTVKLTDLVSNQRLGHSLSC